MPASEEGIASTELDVIGPTQPPGPGARLKLARSAHGTRSLPVRFRLAARQGVWCGAQVSLVHFFQVSLVAAPWENGFWGGFGVCPKPRDLSKHLSGRDLRNTPSTAATEIPAVVSKIERKIPQNGPGMDRFPGVMRGNSPSLSAKPDRFDWRKTASGRLSFTTYFFDGDRPPKIERHNLTRTRLQEPVPDGLRRGRQRGSLDDPQEHLWQPPQPPSDSPCRALSTRAKQAAVNSQPSISVG